MPIQQITEARTQVVSTIRQVAATQNADFRYLLNQAQVESGLDPSARAGTSSAVGLFQFTSGTWLEMVKRHGDKVGLASEAQTLRSGSPSATARQQILDLRNEPRAATALAAHLAADNAQALASAGHKSIGPTELYLAHFLGSGGASTFLNGLRNSPGDAASKALPAAAAANVGVFFRNSTPQSYQDIYNRFAEKFGQPSQAISPLDALMKDPAPLMEKVVENFDAKFRQVARSALSSQPAQAPTNEQTTASTIPVTEEAMTQYLKNFSLADHASGMTQMGETHARDASQRASTEGISAPPGEQNFSPLASGVRLMLRAVDPQTKTDGAQTALR